MTGETQTEDIARAEVQPDAVYESIGEMGHILENMSVMPE